MDSVAVAELGKIVLWSTFGITVVLGIVMQKTGFCTMGAVSDAFIMSNWTRLKQWSLAIGVAMIGVALMSYFGIIDTSKSIYTGTRVLYLSLFLGGVLFGIGMVLASGCGSKTLVRIGGGNLKSVVVFLVLGLTAYMTMRGFLGVIRVDTVDKLFFTLGSNQDLPSVIAAQTSIAKPLLQLILGFTIGGALVAYAVLDKSFWTLDNLLAGFGIGLGICAIWWVSGALGYVAEDPNTLEEVFLRTNTGRMESLSFVAPFAFTLDWLMLYSDTSRVLTLGIVAVVGIITGSAISAIATKKFRWESFRNAEDTGNHLVGGALMGFGGITAMGCTVGQGLTGISTLAIGSFIALPGFILGAYLCLLYLQWRMAPNPCQ